MDKTAPAWPASIVATGLALASYPVAVEEREIRSFANDLYLRTDWNWALGDDKTICHGWKPESGFLQYHWQGYDEALLMYVLALGSPTHAIPAIAYQAWCSTYEWKRCFDIDYLYAGPLFVHQLSHLWIDFRGVRDAYMRGKNIDYFENSRRATQIQQRYAIGNPLGFEGYCAQCWGITASDGPGPATRKINGIERRFYDYEGRGAPYGIDDGTLSPWAVVASLPFAPEIVLPTLHHCVHTLQLHHQPYGFSASFNHTYVDAAGSPGWESPYCFGLNVGPIVLMVENHRSGMLWQLMRGCRWVSDGLRCAGFEGGWLSAREPQRMPGKGS